MGRINVKIDRELEEKFRTKVFERKGMKKGNITNAMQEAMLMWINSAPPQYEKLELNTEMKHEDENQEE